MLTNRGGAARPLQQHTKGGDSFGTKEEAQAQFGFLMNAFEYGAPPHGGLAFGLDRLVATMGGSESIRDYIAFPKNNSGRDTMIDAPSPLDEKQLKEFGEKIPAEKKSVIENALTKLKDAHKMQDLDTIEAATKELNDAWMAASQDMYNATNPAEQQGEGQPSGDAGKANAENVTDAEFEEVK